MMPPPLKMSRKIVFRACETEFRDTSLPDIFIVSGERERIAHVNSFAEEN